MRTINPLRSRSGFTLAELMIVVAMIGIVATIAIPNIHLGQFQANAAMQSVGSVLMSSQRLAVTRQHDVVVRFDTNNNVITVLNDTDDDGTKDLSEVQRAFPLGDGIIFGRGAAPARPGASTTVTFTRVTNGMPSVTFHRNGSASQNGGFYLVSPRRSYGESGAHARYVEITRSTGRPAWYRYTGSAWKRGF